MGIFKSFVTVGVDPSIMGIGPLPAVQKLLRKNGLTIDDIDLFEVNEAFASQAVYVQRSSGIPDDKLNVNGGAIALGHPLGCTGAKLTATALHELQSTNAEGPRPTHLQLLWWEWPREHWDGLRLGSPMNFLIRPEAVIHED